MLFSKENGVPIMHYNENSSHQKFQNYIYEIDVSTWTVNLVQLGHNKAIHLLT